MSVQVHIHWFRHAESAANALVDNSTVFTAIRTRLQEMKLRDPGLSRVGLQQVQEAQPPHVQLVIASHLHRSIHTALRLYPEHNVHIVCGLDEIWPSPVNTPNKDPIKRLSQRDANRLVLRYNQSNCRGLRCKNSAWFWRELDQLVREHCAWTSQDKIHVAVVGHAMWLSVNLWQSKFQNLERRVTVRTVRTSAR